MDIDYDIQSFSSIDGKGQVAQFSLNNYNLLLLASVDLLIFNVYSSFGYSGGNSSFRLLGEYNLEYDSDSGLPIAKNLNLAPIVVLYPDALKLISIGSIRQQ